MSHQPESTKTLTRKELSRIVENLKYRKRAEEQSSMPYLPLDMGLFLTARCNLRCRHCFEWNDDGFLKNGDSTCSEAELPIKTIKECLSYTKEAGTRLYLWGGEPLLYSDFHALCELLKNDSRWTTICTNGLLIESRLEDLKAISDHLVLLISLDGFRSYNDAIRGKGTYDKVMANIALLKKQKEAGVFHGEVSVCCVIGDAMIGRLYEFCEAMETMEINTLYLSFPWYISKETANRMDEEVQRRFGDVIREETIRDASWHHFTYHISEEYTEALKDDLCRINERTWKIRVRFQPALEPEEIDDFILGGTCTAQKRTKCLAPFNRMDILQNGEVSACKLFREFTVGTLKEQSVKEIWEGERMRAMRQKLSCGLMPVCSKCVLLYLNGE